MFQALNLPVICNMDPHSVYNKLEEFETFVKEESVDLLLMSESWERENLTLDQIIKLCWVDWVCSQAVPGVLFGDCSGGHVATGVFAIT